MGVGRARSAQLVEYTFAEKGQGRRLSTAGGGDKTRIERARRPLRGLGSPPSQAPAAAESPASGCIPTPAVTRCDAREAAGTPEEAALGGIWVGDRQGGAIGRDLGHGGVEKEGSHEYLFWGKTPKDFTISRPFHTRPMFLI